MTVSPPSSSGGVTLSSPADATAPGSSVGQEVAFLELYNGATWDKQRTPVVFKTVSVTAAGSTALWTPAGGKKFRLLRYMLTITSNANLAAGAVEVVQLLDVAAALGQTHSVFVPTAAVATAAPPLYVSPWVDLGNGYLSTAANNVLNVNLGTALAGGACQVIACGVEE